LPGKQVEDSSTKYYNRPFTGKAPDQGSSIRTPAKPVTDSDELGTRFSDNPANNRDFPATQGSPGRKGKVTASTS
jgi:hypothetical protein